MRLNKLFFETQVFLSNQQLNVCVTELFELYFLWFFEAHVIF